VRRFGPNRRVVGLQIANEVNLGFSPDSSDGSYGGARDALVQGVIAAKREAARLGYDQLRIGFNWAYRTDPASETSFWQALRDRGGAAFVRSLDYIGLDVYPGTFFPPAESDIGGYRDAMVNAMSTIRCYATIPGIPASVPIEIGENGWPTYGARSYDDQASILRVMVQAVQDFRGTYNVRDYRWFNLRDSKTGDAGVFQNAGLLTDDYSEKPAFAAYRELVHRYTASGEAAPKQSRPRLKVRLKRRFGHSRAGAPRSARASKPHSIRAGKPGHARGSLRCAASRVRATVAGRDRRLALRAGFFRDGRRVARDVHRPLSRVLEPRRRPRRTTRHRVVVRVRLADGRMIRLARQYRRCGH
jgi:hypothetical protein